MTTPRIGTNALAYSPPRAALGSAGVALARRAADQLYLTLLPAPDAAGAADEAESVYAPLVAFLRRRGAVVVQERIYGCCDAAHTILGVRCAALGNIPATFIEGASCTGTALAGVHVVAALPSPSVTVNPIVWDAADCGRRVETEDGTFIYLSGIHGLGAGDRPAQARRMFQRARKILESEGASFHSVLRTWIYLPNLLHWYAEFNQARHEAFRAAGLLTDEGAVWLPASTGIQARNPYGAECLMDLLAVLPRAGKSADRRPAASPLQNEPIAYGSAFSRSVLFEQNGIKRLYISGTASIDKDGATCHHGDAAAQIRTTVRIIGRLLASQVLSFADLWHATAFFKSPRDAATFQHLWARTDGAALPVVCAQADICRSDLLFEMEALAGQVADADCTA